MNAADLTFSIGNVISIVTVVVATIGTLYATKRNVDKAIMLSKQYKSEFEEYKLQAEKKESKIYERINEIKVEQHEANEKLWGKLDLIAEAQLEMKVCLAKITGIIEATNNKKNK